MVEKENQGMGKERREEIVLNLQINSGSKLGMVTDALIPISGRQRQASVRSMAT